MSRVDIAVTTTCTTLAEAVDQVGLEKCLVYLNKIVKMLFSSQALDTRNFKTVYELIEGGHSVNQIITDNGSSLIHRAAKYGCIGFTQNLLR